MGLFGSSGGSTTVVENVYSADSSKSVTSAVAKSISSGAEDQVQAQQNARQRSSGIASTFKRLNAADTSGTGKSKLGQ